MNQKSQTSIFFFVLILSISCSTESALEQIRATEFANDFVGQQIVDTILIQQQSGGSADVVVRLLNGLIFDLEKQQKQHDTEHRQKNIVWAAQLRSYTYRVRILTLRIAYFTRRIVQFERKVRYAMYTLKKVRTQISLVEGKKAGLIAARTVDHEAHEIRSKRQSEMLKAVNYIIGELNLALKNGNYVQLDNIKQELMRLHKENPLQAFVQLTMTFNPQSVKFAITKLNEVRDGLSASITNDNEGEAEAVQQFKSLLSQLNRFLAQAQRELARWNRILKRFQIQLARFKRARAFAVRQRIMYRTLIAKVIESRKIYNANYEASKIKRAQETGTIQKVIKIISVAAPAMNRVEGLKFTPTQ